MSPAFRKPLLVVALFTFFVVTLGVASFAQEIRVGVVQDQSGLNSDVSSDYLAGARTYFDHINSQGGVRGRKIAVSVKDDGGDPAQSVLLTKELITAERVDILFGFTGDESIAAIARDSGFRNAGIALFAPLSGADSTATQDAIYYVRPSYRDEARHVIKHFGLLGIQEFAIAAVDSPLGNQLSLQIRAELNASGRKLVSQVKFPLDLRALDTTAKRLLGSSPKIVIIAADTVSMAEFVKAFRKLDRGTTLVGFSTVNHRTLIELAKPEFAVSTIITQVVPHPNLEMSKIQIEHIALMKKFREEPPSHLTLEGFMAAKALVSLFERAGTINRAKLLEGLAGSNRIDLGGITLSFSPSQDRGSSFVDLAYLRKSGVLVQ